jgi:hypothetical protein
VLTTHSIPFFRRLEQAQEEIRHFGVRRNPHHIFGVCIIRSVARILLTLYSQTIALEWPDFEAEEKKREKAKRKKVADDFIVSDSDDSGSDRPKNKKKKDRAYCVFTL